MKQVFVSTWKSSVQPRKQRKYVANAPRHIKSSMVVGHLEKTLRQKYNTRNVRMRVGDKVKILRGQFKGVIGKIDSIDVHKQKLFIEKVEQVKKSGAKVPYPIHTSNVLVMELILTDKKRKEKLQHNSQDSKVKESKAASTKKTTEKS
ncbi:MAG: 50S ribosomal protein L24 [Candidatus Woesearchaeota archaeon]